MNFEFATATRILFGPGTLKQLVSIAKELGSRALIVTGRSQERGDLVREILAAGGVNSIAFPVYGEPTVLSVKDGTAIARGHGCEFVVSVGGGSAIDEGKAIAAMLTNTGDVLDYLEVIGSGKTLSSPSAPFIAIPTTAGTGSEVTRNAVLGSAEHKVKVSLRSPLMLPRVALVDPELTHGLPAAVTATTGMDALTQLIEPHVCARPTPLVDALCQEGIRRVARSLRKAYVSGTDSSARSDMSLASLFGGLALANAGLGAVHGFAGPLGGMFPAAHGAVCAALLPHVMRANIHALRTRAPETDTLERYRQIAVWLTENQAAAPEDGVEWTRHLVKELSIPGLSSFGMNQTHIPEVVEKAVKASSMKANPIALTRDELSCVLEAAL